MNFHDKKKNNLFIIVIKCINIINRWSEGEGEECERDIHSFVDFDVINNENERFN